MAIDPSMEPMLEVFIYESTTLLEQLDEILLEAEKSKSFSEDNINEIFRTMHTIKGSSAMMEFTGISTLAHAVEDVFFIIREEPARMANVNETLFDLVFQASDFLKTEIESVQNSGEANKDPSGMIGELNDGDEIEVVNPQGQATDAASYISLQQHLIASGQGLSYESVSRDMKESTYSSARQGMIEDGMTYAEEAELLMEVLDEIYETFIISAVLAGKIPAADFWESRQKYFAHHCVKPPKPWIDPLKEASAVKVALQTGQKTWKQAAAENGSDWQTQIDDIADVLKYARDRHGIDLGGVIFGQTIQEQAAKPVDDVGGNGTGTGGE